MKKVALVSVVALLFSLLLSAFVAPPKNNNKWPDPTVTVLSGDTEYTVTLLGTDKLAGAFKGASGFPVPSGFHDGDKQFGGKALTISGVSYGSERVCFALPNYAYGWRGSVYQWNSTSWTALATDIIEGKDGAATLACSTVYGNGTYALLVAFDISKAKTKPTSAPVGDGCIHDISSAGWGRGDTLATFGFKIRGAASLDGVSANWTISETTPALAFGTPSISGTSIFQSWGGPDAYIFTGDVPYAIFPTHLTFTVYLEDGCHSVSTSIDED
jgi:hypothetical protein